MTRNLRALSTAAAVLAIAVAPAQAQRTPVNPTTQAKEQRARAERDTRRYEKLKAYALNQYQTDLDFRDEVDAHFDEVQRQHMSEAYNYNAAEPARPTVGPRWRSAAAADGLYDNKLVADYINRVGQRLVAVDSERLFAFRLLANPYPSHTRCRPAPSTSPPASCRFSTTKRSSHTCSRTRWRTCSSITGS